MALRVRSQRARGNATIGIAGTVVVHAALAALLLVTVKSAPAFPPVYAVNLVAAPAPRADTRPAPEAVARPAEEKPVPTIPTPKPAQVQPKPAPVRPPTPTPQQREPAPRTQSAQPPAPGETPGTGSDAITVKTPGLTFPFPGYLENIYNQIYRRWERPLGSNLSAEVTFLIMRDGSMNDFRFSRSSGNFSFDLSAQGAVEAAGNTKAFGPLPDGFEADVLLVSFFFSPAAKR
jgi:outer membrane biosynthesis protein TonB